MVARLVASATSTAPGVTFLDQGKPESAGSGTNRVKGHANHRLPLFDSTLMGVPGVILGTWRVEAVGGGVVVVHLQECVCRGQGFSDRVHGGVGTIGTALLRERARLADQRR